MPGPATEPRYLASHHGDHWIRIYVYRSGVSEMTFDLKGIRVLSDQGIALFFRRAGGGWFYGSDPGKGSWNLALSAGAIREVLIRSTNGSALHCAFDDLGVAAN